VRGKLFEKKLFVTDEELGMGGPIQKWVCNDIKICGGERARVFWGGQGGRKLGRGEGNCPQSFCRKQQAAQNAMKLAFKGR
jgi:hypothetical protein